MKSLSPFFKKGTVIISYFSLTESSIALHGGHVFAGHLERLLHDLDLPELNREGDDRAGIIGFFAGRFSLFFSFCL